MAAASSLARGILFGLMVAIPVGPISLLCIQRTLYDGRLAGLASGLGAATADALYGCLAALGLTVVTSFLVGESRWLQLLGGLFLVGLGVRTALARASMAALDREPASPFRQYGSALLLTLANPMTILSYMALLSSGSLNGPRGALTGLLTVVGVFTGSALWWLCLSAGVAALRDKFDRRFLLWMGKATGALLAAWGLLVVMHALMD